MQGYGNGHWVRTRTDRDAKLFLQERQLEKDRQRATRERRDARAKAFAERVRGLWDRLRRR